MNGRDLIAEAVIKAVRSHLPFEHYRIFYFGSRASGKATPRSDFDVGIDAGQQVPLSAITKITDALDSIPVLQKIDLVDFASVPKEFARRAGKNIQIIYEQ